MSKARPSHLGMCEFWGSCVKAPADSLQFPVLWLYVQVLAAHLWPAAHAKRRIWQFLFMSFKSANRIHDDVRQVSSRETCNATQC